MGQEVLLSKESGQQAHKPWSVGDSAVQPGVSYDSAVPFIQGFLCQGLVLPGCGSQRRQHSLMQDIVGKGAPGHPGVGLPSAANSEGSLKEVI